MDLDYSEDSIAEIDMNLVGAEGGYWIEVQGTAESGKHPKDHFSKIMDLADQGLADLYRLQKQAYEKGVQR